MSEPEEDISTTQRTGRISSEDTERDVRLRFATLADFTPEGIAAQVPELQKLLGLRDALYALENNGLTVEVEGFGKVSRQSLLPGTRINGQAIRLYLR